jgi:hypothetical protein
VKLGHHAALTVRGTCALVASLVVLWSLRWLCCGRFVGCAVVASLVVLWSLRWCMCFGRFVGYDWRAEIEQQLTGWVVFWLETNCCRRARTGRSFTSVSVVLFVCGPVCWPIWQCLSTLTHQSSRRQRTHIPTPRSHSHAHAHAHAHAQMQMCMDHAAPASLHSLRLGHKQRLRAKVQSHSPMQPVVQRSLSCARVSFPLPSRPPCLSSRVSLARECIDKK